MSVAVQTIIQDALLQRTPSLSNSLSTTDASDDVNDLRIAFPRRPLPTPPVVHKASIYRDNVPSHQPTPPPAARPRPPRALRPSFFTSARTTGLMTISARPRILACLLTHLTWDDFEAMSGASHSIRRIFLDAGIKDVVFSHFCPGYRSALRLRDKRLWEDTIRMDYADLALLMASLETPLHRYPMHAISVLSSDFHELPSVEQLETTKYLQTFSQVHSRTVLFLQNMVHSTMQPVPSELDDPRWKTNSLGASQMGSLRELTFPAPLSYFDATSQNSKPNKQLSSRKSSPPALSVKSASLSPHSKPKKLSSKLHSPTLSLPSKSRHTRRWGSESAAAPAAGPSSFKPSQSVKQERRGSRLSIFGNANRPPLPPPAPEPESHRIYSGTWRRNNRQSYMFASEDESVLRPPNRRFLNGSNFSSNSSLGSSPTQSSGSQINQTPSSSSPHDLVAATSRTRAPILRVFVPCSTLSEDVINACEDQLIEDNLWRHLSVGDVVCNFGYVPPIEETEDAPPSPDRDHRRWLIFTGDRLIIYYPNQPPPVPDALSLPSPFYYTHIFPSTFNPRFKLKLPPFRAQYHLAPLTHTIQSSHAHTGLVRVKTYAWLAMLDAHLSPALREAGWEMNDGWAGEWALQGEGTPEGRVFLQELLRGDRSPDAEREYEVVIEKSGSGRLWLRVLNHATRAHDAPDLDANELGLRTSP